MLAFELLIRGILAGLAISIPVGPVNVLCISRTLAKGPKAGLISGLGAATADTIYGAIAGFSISFVISFLVRELFWIRFFGGMLLIGIGFLYYFRRPKPLSEEKGEGSANSEYATAFLLNLTNPTTVLSFLAVLAALGLGQHKARALTVLVVVGIFCGAMIWWATLAAIANHFRDRLDDRAVVWMNRIAGLAIGGFGLLTMLLSRGHPR
jgi:threonine/homoserine/homoserine lactone efflux protein